MTTIRLLCTMALEGVMTALAAEQGLALEAEFLPTVRLLERIRAGERADVAVLTAEGAEALVAERVLASRHDIARSFIGVAVRAGRAKPAIGTETEFIATLLAAESVAMSQAGASGLHMAKLLDRLGIADAIRPKATILPSGYTATLAASGAVDLAIQQVSELLMVDGVDIVGRIPASLGGQSLFAAGLFRETPHREEAASLLTALADPARAALYDRWGLELVAAPGLNPP